MVPFPLLACLCWAVYLPGLWSLALVSLSLPFLSAFFLLSLAGFHHHFGQVQEDLSPLNLGMKYAEHNVKHPPMNIGRGVSVSHPITPHPHGSAAGISLCQFKF
jgi:fatty acid desaturase